MKYLDPKTPSELRSFVLEVYNTQQSAHVDQARHEHGGDFRIDHCDCFSCQALRESAIFISAHAERVHA